MMILAVGGSGSGKSAYAEELAVSLSHREGGPFGFPDGLTGKKADGVDADMRKYYLATMQVYDREGREKVEKHRKSRDGKGFFTIEQPGTIQEALEKMEAGERVALLECVSNLTANEMFRGAHPVPEEAVAEQIVRGIGLLKENTTHLVVVSNKVFEDGIVYEETTMAYIRTMGMINRELAAMADRVVEVVAGIPVTVKQ
ncbi:MAG: bifunctional adenosylcobinamide kinase/adenosylcobinamide-phosphate guanylyltransferase [Eubacterium sp.]|nr:bifunctional adenosylcobinamide kinase/adenosylcobinamide-phosphate guanylyltransferase [Eubacterium sp.]MCM1214722.1 bifunctional adenosylcobinamide kinase/adenosylcobinamide-phosphate guanylyltransferase [Lachnospiraceae bacterium]MCM1303946.1 bifunctional adenosylcobinamide kinase/adenosylcobinamide-phosphate guanylyltransferase [Butyrivibrio sp.]MCM1344876.1 bifunctional adenosylcobinamide kinase/adenosylcobinamide-phosphate guanylyltransferase [Muribaculaceae bacterium]MCM1239541.1 bifu